MLEPLQCQAGRKGGQGRHVRYTGGVEGWLLYAGATQRKRMHLILFPGPRHFLFDQNNGKQHILLLLHVTV